MGPTLDTQGQPTAAPAASEDLALYLDSLDTYTEPTNGPAPRTATKPLTILTAPLPVDPVYKTSSFEDLVTLYFDLATIEARPLLPLEVKYEAEMVDYPTLPSFFDSFSTIDAYSDLGSTGLFKAPALVKTLIWSEATLINSALITGAPLTGLSPCRSRSRSAAPNFPPFPTNLYPWSNPAFDR